MQHLRFNKMVHEEFTPELGQEDPHGDHDFEKWGHRKNKPKIPVDPGNLIVNSDDNPFHKISIQLDIQILLKFLELELFLRSIRACCRLNTLITSIANKVEIARVIHEFDALSHSLVPFDSPRHELGLVS